MAMEHKAYVFDWSDFDSNLHSLLVNALTTNHTFDLEAFIEKHLAELTDPYQGEPLTADWRDTMENRDVHAYGDYALTKFYNPTNSFGLGYEWMQLNEELPTEVVNSLLGFPIGPVANLFDPGRYGSFFQTPEGVGASLTTLQSHASPKLASYLGLLRGCVARGRGVYVTF